MNLSIPYTERKSGARHAIKLINQQLITYLKARSHYTLLSAMPTLQMKISTRSSHIDEEWPLHVSGRC